MNDIIKDLRSRKEYKLANQLVLAWGLSKSRNSWDILNDDVGMLRSSMNKKKRGILSFSEEEETFSTVENDVETIEELYKDNSILKFGFQRILSSLRTLKRGIKKGIKTSAYLVLIGMIINILWKIKRFL